MTDYETIARQRLSFDQAEETPRTPWYERVSYMVFLCFVALASAYAFALLMFSLSK